MRVVLAVDSVKTLEILVDEMKSRLWPSATEVRVISIVEDNDVPFETWRDEGYGVSAIRREMQRRGEQITALAIESLREIGVQAEVTIMRGNPEFLISFAARSWPADLIMIRAHNRKDFRNRLLGSVAKSVTESAPCSVEVVRTHDELVTADRGLRVLLGTDGSAASLAAARAIVETTWPEETEVRVVSAVNPMIYSLEELGFGNGSGTERAHRAIGDAVQVLRASSLQISADVITGKAARQIIDRARQWQADLIVVGTNERKGLSRLFSGSTSAAVARGAHCSVRIIRDRGASRGDKSLHKRSERPGQSFEPSRRAA